MDIQFCQRPSFESGEAGGGGGGGGREERRGREKRWRTGNKEREKREEG